MLYIAPAEKVATPNTSKFMNLSEGMATCKGLRRISPVLMRGRDRTPNFLIYQLSFLPLPLLINYGRS